MQLISQRAIIIGGSSGMGYATARKLLDQGMHVVIVGRDTEKLDQAAASLHSDLLETRALDISDQRAVMAFFENAEQFNHLVLTVGVSVNCMGNFRDLDLSSLEKGFANKVLWQLHVLQAAIPKLDASESSVTFVTAASARHAAPGASAPSAINGALESMIPTLARELGPIRVNGVSPGVIDTPRWQSMPEKERTAMYNRFANALPVGRVGTADNIAACISLLVSNDYITGSVLECDGGAHTL